MWKPSLKNVNNAFPKSNVAKQISLVSPPTLTVENKPSFVSIGMVPRVKPNLRIDANVNKRVIPGPRSASFRPKTASPLDSTHSSKSAPARAPTQLEHLTNIKSLDQLIQLEQFLPHDDHHDTMSVSISSAMNDLPCELSLSPPKRDPVSTKDSRLKHLQKNQHFFLDMPATGISECNTLRRKINETFGKLPMEKETALKGAFMSFVVEGSD
jgi:hypothetical protein